MRDARHLMRYMHVRWLRYVARCCIYQTGVEDPVDCLDQADDRNSETQVQERRDNVVCAGDMAGEEGNDEVDL